MPTPEDVGRRWIHPKYKQVRYYVDDFRTLLGIDAPEKVKVWMNREGKVYVPYCDDKDLEVQIIRAMDRYMRGDRKVIGIRAKSNVQRAFSVCPDAIKGNTMTYDNIESARKRILTLREKGQNIYRIQRKETMFGEVYRILMTSYTSYGELFTAGYQAVEHGFTDGSVIWYHGEHYSNDLRYVYNFEGADTVKVVVKSFEKFSVRVSDLRRSVLDIVRKLGIKSPRYEYRLRLDDDKVNYEKILFIHDKPVKEVFSSGIQHGYQKVGKSTIYPFTPYLYYHGQYYWR